MSWEILFILFVATLIVVFLTGIPVALGFLAVNAVVAIALVGLAGGGRQTVGSIGPTLMSFSLMPIPLFVFMGELLYQSGLANRTLDGISKWLGRLPGRLSLLTMAGGSTFSVFSGSSIATTSMLGTLLVPEMRRRGYSTELSVGSVLAAGGLAMIIPPSALAVLVGTIGNISIGRLLIAGFLPGLLLAALAMGYIVVRSWLKPELAPPYDVEHVSWGERFRALFIDILPIGSVLVVVMGLIVSGLATPTESAAVGAISACMLIAAYRKLTFHALRAALLGSIRITAGILLIIAGAAAYSQLMAYSGVVRGMVQLVTDLDVSPLLIVAAMLLLLAVLGSPLEHISMMLITLPVFVPIVTELGLDPVWFGILFLIMLDVASLTPPLGLALFIMNSVTPDDIGILDIIKAAVPFIGVDIAAIICIFFWPDIALFLPRLFFD